MSYQEKDAKAQMGDFKAIAGGFEELAVSSTALVLSSELTIPAAATHVYMSVEDADVNVTFDGDTPTVESGTGVGHKLADGDSLIYPKHVVSGMKVIRRSTSDAAMKFTYLRHPDAA